MRTANSYFMKKWPDPHKRIVTNKERAANIWTRGVYYEGLMALYQMDPQKAYYDYAVTWGEKHNWKPVRGEVYTRHADNQNCGMTYIDLYRLDPKPERIAAIKENFNETAITISAQEYLKKFYESHGFIQTSEMYLEDDIPHIQMKRS